MQIVPWYALACAIIGIMPCSFPFLVTLEVALIYHLSNIHRIPFRMGEFSLIASVLVTCSLILKTIVGFLLNMFVGVGWFIKGGVAFCFVMAVGWLVDSYYANERRKLDHNRA